jgi:ribonuclease P protein component
MAPNDGQATRLGISVGKRVGKAVVRNQVKRRVREAVRHRYDDLLPGFDLVFIARAPAATAEWPMLRDATDELLRRSRVLLESGCHLPADALARYPAADRPTARTALPVPHA